MYAAKEMHEKKQMFSEKAQSELSVYMKAITGILNITIDVFRQEDIGLVLEIQTLENIIDELNAEIKKRHIRRLRKGECTIELGFILSDITTSFERISDHCSNISVSIMQSKDDSFEVHEYKETLRHQDEETFQKILFIMKEQYKLPE